MTATDVARRYFDCLGNGGVEGALAQFGPGARFVAPMGELPMPDGVRAYLGCYDQSFKGHGFTITRALEAGDQVCIEGTWHGTHSGPLKLPHGSPLPATGRHIEAPFVTMFTVRDGKIAERRGYRDLGGFMARLTAF